jgi:hypothetical protein
MMAGALDPIAVDAMKPDIKAGNSRIDSGDRRQTHYF